jgi:hypothetical protein
MHILMAVAALVFFLATLDTEGWWCVILLIGFWVLPTNALWTTFCVVYFTVFTADVIFNFLKAFFTAFTTEFVKTLRADIAKKKFQDALKNTTPKDDDPSKT